VEKFIKTKRLLNTTMKTRTIRIEFNEQQKAVTTNVRIEGTEEEQYDDILEEAQELFKKASKFSKEQTMNKIQGVKKW